jgi:hypothetical protein
MGEAANDGEIEASPTVKAVRVMAKAVLPRLRASTPLPNPDDRCEVVCIDLL